MKPQLFLLNPNFIDSKVDNLGQLYYCPQCATVEGILTYYPELRDKLNIQYVDFSRPRPTIIELLGSENQSCPVLVIPIESASSFEFENFKSYGNYLFADTPETIASYFSKGFQVGMLHP
jgi:hypothetical protein